MPWWLSDMGFRLPELLLACLSVSTEHDLQPEEGPFMGTPQTWLKHSHPLWCAPNSCRLTVVYLSRQMTVKPATSFSVLPLSLHPGSIKCSESPTPYPISVREDHQILSLIMEGKESDPDRHSENLSHS